MSRGSESSALSPLPNLWAVMDPQGRVGRPGATVLSRLDPAEVDHFQRAGWRFRSSRPRRDDPRPRGRVLVRSDNSLAVLTDSMVIELDGASLREDVGRWMERYGLQIVRRLGFGESLWMVRASGAGEVPALVERLGALPEVAHIEPVLVEFIDHR